MSPNEPSLLEAVLLGILLHHHQAWLIHSCIETKLCFVCWSIAELDSQSPKVVLDFTGGNHTISNRVKSVLLGFLSLISLSCLLCWQELIALFLHKSEGSFYLCFQAFESSQSLTAKYVVVLYNAFYQVEEAPLHFYFSEIFFFCSMNRFSDFFFNSTASWCLKMKFLWTHLLKVHTYLE